MTDEQPSGQDRFEHVMGFLQTVASMGLVLAGAMSKVQRFLDQHSDRMLEIAHAFQNLPPRYKESLLTMARHGWFLDEEMAFDMPMRIKEVFDTDKEEANRILCQHFSYRTDGIEERLCELFPSRARILRQAFRAHRQGDYELSVPVFLIQTDGICHELTGWHYFMRDRNVPLPRTARVVKADEIGELGAAYLAPLGNVVPVNMNPVERGDDFVGLNRHTVIHGESLDYGTQENSLRAMSLLGYTSNIPSLIPAVAERLRSGEQSP